MLNWKLALLCFLATVFAVIRFALPTTGLDLPGTYRAFAHLFVGGLFGAWLANRNKEILWIGLGLTGVEVIAFLLGRIS